MEELLLRAERRILAYHADQLRHWIDEQRFVLQRSAALDRDAVAAQASLCESCLGSVRADLRAQRAVRDGARHEAAASAEACDRLFRGELQALGSAYAAEAADLLAKAKAKVLHSHDVCEKREWDLLDRSLRAVMLKHMQARQGFGVVDGVAELWESGEFQPHLEAELEGWATSQRSDVVRLHADIDAEWSGALQALETRLKDLTADAIMGMPSTSGLAEMASTQAKRLSAIESDLQASYMAEIEEAQEQCDRSYRQYDTELQCLLSRTMAARMWNTCSMRRYRLALCRWRLDYQQVLHELRDKLDESAVAPSRGSERRRRDRRRLEGLRRLVRGLWSRQPPVAEVSRFLGSTALAAARAGLAAPLLRVYEEELRRHGALPLLEHAARPELLECWLQALRSPGP